ncbi:beta-ketoacyl synthase N-terminal-like domain-containing protein [Sulfuriroseicoccus oceanibius]|uniref:L,D-transpeptidase family protein n=1 Tax=Sulfuriroseicoccus oceanibius TaxID=2707525 RepID=A0A7T7F3S3_9BACT|nr:beta-ketoacyl synthase N-terminal-like domain-containing protein [Sulfuriroseicoccus oceanibius]QQL46277.1 L,D-transpeptidase family protein [Sulfuriroseicoccus oceanibius]
MEFPIALWAGVGMMEAMTTTTDIGISGIGMWSALGKGWEATRESLIARRNAFVPLGESPMMTDKLEAYRELPLALLAGRGTLKRRMFGVTTALAMDVAQMALEDAGVRKGDDLSDMGVVVGSSRGNIGGWLTPLPGRRPVGILEATNSMHSEIAAAVTIEWGIRGPYHVLANGCSAGLAAVDMARMMIHFGQVRRVLVIGVDLPVSPELLEAYAATDMLSRNGVNDPYDSRSAGFLPGEAGAAMVFEAVDDACADEAQTWPRLLGCWTNSDAAHLLGVPDGGPGVRDLVDRMRNDLDGRSLRAICPHASGTEVHGRAEADALRTALVDWPAGDVLPSLHVMKPYTGHSMGASGAFDLAVLAVCGREGWLPPNLPGLCGIGASARVPEAVEAVDSGEVLVKIASGMGGQNVVVALEVPALVSTADDVQREHAGAADELVVDVASQTMDVFAAGVCVRRYPVSTARNGVGFAEGSYQTPTGNFEISEVFGADAPLDTVFQGRVPVGHVGDDAFDADADLVVARILWLAGLDEENANSKERYIYIHGTNHEELIGEPASCGCVRMRNADVAELFEMVGPGTPVRIVG